MSIKTPRQLQPPVYPQADRPVEAPPLNAGDRLSRAEFERRYEAHPEIKKAELIEGEVYMPSPTRLEQHGEPHGQVVTWLGVYAASTPGTRLADNASVRLDLENEMQPDALLRISPECGGRARITVDDYLEGLPDLIVEVVASSASYDLHAKKRVYARSGVPEYLVAQMYEKRVDWFVLREGIYETLEPDETGILRSEVFPGLWLQPETLWSADLATMLATLQEGLASPEHAEFLVRLREQQPSSPTAAES